MTGVNALDALFWGSCDVDDLTLTFFLDISSLTWSKLRL